MSGDFSPEQKRYLEGFTSGLQVGRAARGLPAGVAPGAPAPAAAEPVGPDAAHLKAQNRIAKEGKKLVDQEKFKRELHPFDGYEKLKDQAKKNEAPKPPDNFRWRFYGLFYVAPAQNSYMCRLRIPNGILTHWQFAGLADLSERYAGGYSHVTTRANLQMREIEPKNAVAMVEAIQDLGLCSRGSGADNIRNVTGTPTAGIDRQELLDTRPYAREWHFHILNERALYGLPRKFNVGFDGGGVIPVLEDTNDIGFTAVEVKPGFGPEPGVYFRLALGGITGHKDFAKDTGVIVKPEEATMVADAVVRVYIDHGDRTDRTKARLKYVLDAWGLEKFVNHVEDRLGRMLTKVPAEAIAPRPPQDRAAHVGVHKQKQDGLNWIGVVLPVARTERGADARPRRRRARIRRRRYPPHGLAESADLRRRRRQGRRRTSRDRRSGPDHEGDLDPRRPGRLHRQCRLQILRLRHQASRRGDRDVVREARRARRAGQHPSHRLPSLLRAALHQRDRPARLQDPGLGGRRSGRGLSHLCRRRLRAGCRARPRDLSRRQSRGRAAHRRAHA